MAQGQNGVLPARTQLVLASWIVSKSFTDNLAV